VQGVTIAIMREAMEQARKSRYFIIDKLAEVIAQPREQLSQYAPRMIVIKIDPAKIKDVIGPGGKVINKIIADTGVEKIDIEDDGSVFITSLDGASGDKAREIVENLTKEVVVGETYRGTVTRIIAIGAFVQILPGKEGLVHISQLAPNRVDKVEDVVKVGEFTPREFTPRDSVPRDAAPREAPPRDAAPSASAPGAPPMRRRRRTQGRHEDE
jgi:polyribonucleotide nucleotidyltransferase